MKLKIFICMLPLTILFSVACKRELSCENCNGTANNQPPVAKAGSDQHITLPKDSALLDGSASADPDGSLTAYKWVKIAGPASFYLANADSAKTMVRSLATGVYQFELTVTDNRGLSAKDTLQISVDSTFVNHPPVACAGADQAISLPTSTVTLDAACSSDPENNITSYQWTKIAGPSAFSILNGNSLKANVTGLVQGTYLFEIKVTDAGGLAAKDTTQVTVYPATLAICDNDTMVVVRGAVSVSLLGELSQARLCVPAAAADKLVFRSGTYGYNPNDDYSPYLTAQIDIYDFSTKTWSVSQLPDRKVAWNYDAVTGNKILYNDLADLEVYDAVANNWSNVYPPVDRNVLQGSWGRNPCLLNNKLYFANSPSQSDPYGINKWVDIYNIPANTWSTAQLSEARTSPFPVVVGNKLLLAGGYRKAVPGLFYDSSNRVDIYDDASSSWSVTEMPLASFVTDAASTDSKVVFALSDHPEKVLLYDIAANHWSEHLLPVPRTNAEVVAIGNKILVAAGNTTAGGSNAVDIYDAASDSWTAATLSRPAMPFLSPTGPYWTGILEGKLLLMTQFPQHTGMNYFFDVYDPANNGWSVVELKSCFKTAPIIVAHSLILGGGEAYNTGNPGQQNTAKVWQIRF